MANSSMPRRPPSSRKAAAARPLLRVALYTVGAVSVAKFLGSGLSFAASSRSSAGVAPAITGSRGRSSSIVRQAGFTFGVVQSDDHQNLVVEKHEDGTRVSTHGGYGRGNWNTVLGDAEIPTKGKSYWEVKIVSKPNDAWEYIGVAEPSSDVTVPLTRNKKGAGYFVGATRAESMIYKYISIDTKKFQEEATASAKYVLGEHLRIAQEKPILLNSVVGYQSEKMEEPKTPYPVVPEKDVDEEVNRQGKLAWGVPGTHVGIDPNEVPPFKPGTVVGVEVDMDAGSLSFYTDGKKYGPVRDHTGKPLDLKGKKIVPAVSVYGRTVGGQQEFGTMEVRTGLAPPS